MPYATPTERLALRNSSDFGLDFVLQIRKNGRESEFPCDSLDHALTLSGVWINTHCAEYVEIFRVLPDGNLKPTIGAN